MGLFLIMTALYAVEKRKSIKTDADYHATRPTAVQGVKPNTIDEFEKLHELWAALSQESFFQNPTEGIELTRDPHTVMVRFSGDEVYKDGEAAMRSNWISVLDRLAAVLNPEVRQGMRIELKGFADEDSGNERLAWDIGQSEYAFSFLRAEWVYRYFEGKWRVPLKTLFSIRGMGGYPQGRSVEIWISFSITESPSAPGKTSNNN